MLLFVQTYILGIWIRKKKTAEFFKQNLIGHSNRNIEGNGIEGDLNCEGVVNRLHKRRIFVWVLEIIHVIF